jgi:hypothetical protein
MAMVRRAAVPRFDRCTLDGGVRETFEKLATEVEEGWARAAWTEEAFPDLAARVLTEWVARGDLPTAEAIGGWVLAPGGISPQIGVDHRFADVQLTLAARDGFYVEALFWTDGSTQIHEHAFAGAFTVLTGSSLHARYAFDATGPATPDLRVGALRRLESELLTVGHVRRIAPGPGFIHSLFHLPRPSVTLVVRTHGTIGWLPQLNYLPTLALNPLPLRPETRQRLAYRQLLLETDDPMADSAARRLLERATPRAAYEVARQSLSRPDGLDRLRAVLDGVAAHHSPAWADAMEAAWRYERRILNVMFRRAEVRDAALRTVLAFAFHLSDRATVLASVSAQRPERDPVEQLLDWIEALAAEPPTRPELGQSLLGVTLPSGWRRVAAVRLRGQPFVPASLDEVKADLVLQNSELLGPLFAPG